MATRNSLVRSADRESRRKGDQGRQQVVATLGRFKDLRVCSEMWPGKTTDATTRSR
jgi:hypothetical protein